MQNALVERFYEIAVHRRRAFVYYIGKALEKYAQDKAVVIAGGFHTSHMQELMKEEGHAFVVVSPRLDVVKDYSTIYRERTRVDLQCLLEQKRRGR